MRRRLLLAALTAAVATCLAVPAYADDAGPLTPPGVSGPGDVGGGTQFDPPSGPVVTLTPDPTMLPPENPAPGATTASEQPASPQATATPTLPTVTSTATSAATPTAAGGAGGSTTVPPGASAMMGPGAAAPDAAPQPVWDMRDALPWWLLWVSTALALGGLGVVWVRRRGRGVPDPDVPGTVTARSTGAEGSE
ncbi:MAG: hypothetical protein JWQ74_2710 [Marmoricola sp.]|nr:hypothetical protein [Marmoricola sp.]